ncbi:hypothetical protein AB1Y20_002084 [Prymnesium parvum]|uniref:Guanine nucleotide-binding protein subunit beta-like protein n=1 Tax=Prymnesium parvum TaxID=97485 RepID=A0AB34J832_PRYPA
MTEEEAVLALQAAARARVVRARGVADVARQSEVVTAWDRKSKAAARLQAVARRKAAVRELDAALREEQQRHQHLASAGFDSSPSSPTASCRLVLDSSSAAKQPRPAGSALSSKPASRDAMRKLFNSPPLRPPTGRLVREATLERKHSESHVGHTGAVHALLMHRGRLASGSADCTVRLWDTASHAQLTVLSLPFSQPQVEHTAVCSLEQSVSSLWSAHHGGSLNIWDAEAGTMLRNLSSAHDGPVWALQRTAEVPEAVASAGADGMVKLWDARQVKPAGQVQTGNAVYALAMSRGTLISSGYDGIVQLWDIRMGSVSLAASLQVR